MEPYLTPTLEHTDSKDTCGAWGPYLVYVVSEGKGQLKMLTRFLAGYAIIPLTLKENLGG